MCGSVVLMARDVPDAPVGERFRAVTRARRAFLGLIARTPIVPICNFLARARSVAPVCGRGAAAFSVIFSGQNRGQTTFSAPSVWS
jgi:hypothetical protein